uniref:VWFC domain-containing protein n=1 Tax=Paramormyrops kingsleyae TaxID=1676925 RepID=A0A3B3S5U3_9TELE
HLQAVFPDASDPCRDCVCREGTVTCESRRCPPVAFGGSSFDLSPLPPGCSYIGTEYLDGQEFPDPRDPCSRCMCAKGEVTCGWRPCPKASCPHPETGPCSCPLCGGCSFHGRSCSNGERFPHPEDKCQLCVCLNGGVSCMPVSCPPVPCRDVAPPPGECCPVCLGSCLHLGQLYESGSTFESLADGCSSCTCLVSVATRGHLATYRANPYLSVCVKTAGKCCYECQGMGTAARVW